MVYCKITGHTRALPKIHHFVPIAPWSVKKIKGIQKVMHVGDNRDVVQNVEQIFRVQTLVQGGAGGLAAGLG